MTYFFILGKNPTLSKAEIEAVLEFLDYRFQIIDFSNNVLIVEIKNSLDIEKLNQRLGGTIKIGKILAKIDSLEVFEDKFFKLIKFGKGKIHFGFSLYGLADKINLQKYLRKLKPVAMEIKRRLREEKNLNSRWVVSKEPALSSVIVKKNQLLKYGSEICFFIKDKPSFAKASEGMEILVGQTLAVQQFEEFGARDYNRPGRDQVSGMLPPKLARIMVNLAQTKPDAKILDPFCGSGTILQEAIVLGYRNLIGSDNSDRAIEDTKKNLDWISKKFEAASSDPLTKLRVTASAVKVFKLDVKDLSSQFEPNSIEAIITEPLLGPPLSGKESQEKIKQIVKDLEKLYLSAFSEFIKVLCKGGKIVIVFPVFKFKNFTEKLNILPQIEKMGFKKENQAELIYSREKQHVWRQIFIFKK